MSLKKNAHFRYMVRYAYRQRFIEIWEKEWKPVISKFKNNAEQAADFIWTNRSKYKDIAEQSITQQELKDLLRAFAPINDKEPKKDIIKEIREQKIALEEEIPGKFFSYLTGRFNRLSVLKNPRDKKAIEDILINSINIETAVEPLWNYINKAAIRHAYEEAYNNFHEIEAKVESLKKGSPSSPFIKSAKVSAYNVVMEYLNNLDIRK